MEARVREIDLQITDPADRYSEEGAQEQDEKKGSLKANEALASWFVFLGFGGFFLILYYCHIGYFPELEWEKSLSFLAAISLLGGGIAAIFGLALVVPGILWSEFLIFDQFLRQRFCYVGPDGREPCFQNLLGKLVLPFAILMAVVHLVALLRNPWGLVAASTVGLVTLCWYSYRKFAEEIDTIRRSPTADERLKFFLEKNESTCLYKYTAAAGLAALASLVSFLVIVAIASPTGKSASLLVVCTLAVVISNLLVAAQFHRKPLRALVTGVIATLMLLISGEILAYPEEALSVRVLDQFGVGGQREDNSVKVVVSKVGREMLTSYQVPKITTKITNPCTSPKGDQSAPCEYGVIESARILSRLGDEYLIEVEGRHIAIPKKEVLSWSKIHPED